MLSPEGSKSCKLVLLYRSMNSEPGEITLGYSIVPKEPVRRRYPSAGSSNASSRFVSFAKCKLLFSNAKSGIKEDGESSPTIIRNAFWKEDSIPVGLASGRSCSSRGILSHCKISN